jgi:hypothetical protein
MDRQEQRHQHHRQERAEKKAAQREHEQANEARGGVHRGWFWGLGVLLMLVAALTWTFIIYPRFIAPI